jgi:hypothetical protein
MLHPMHSRFQSDRIRSLVDRVNCFTERNGILIMQVIILGISLIYDYPETLLKRPQSIHNWRQCDGASLALNYYQEGMHFFRPATHELTSDKATTGYTAPSEIPVLYYVVAILYKVFGYHEYIFRATTLILFFLGLLYLYKLAWAVLRQFFYAAAVVVLLFSSPLIVYYANNFMPNTVGLSFTIIGWYYFYRYSQHHKTRTFLVAMLFFGFAGAMKITELSGPIIVLVMLLIDRFKIFDLKLGSAKHFFVKLSALLLVFSLVGSWVLYAKWYNNLHETAHFSTFTFPLWKIGPEDIAFILHKMRVLWLTDYYLPFTLCSLLCIALFVMFFYKRIDRILAIASAFMIIGLIIYSMLWFQALGDHDYFYIGFYILPVFIFINFFLVIASFNLKAFYKWLIQVTVLVFLIFNVAHARYRQGARYNSWMNDYPEMQDMYNMSSCLNQLKIGRSDTIVFYPSIYIRPLYLMNLKGWIIGEPGEITHDQVFKDSSSMENCIRKGAGYFITNNLKSVVTNKALIPYTRDLYGRNGSIFIFRIPPRQDNFCAPDSLFR